MDYQPLADEIATLSYQPLADEIATLSCKLLPAWGLGVGGRLFFAGFVSYLWTFFLF